MVIIIIMVIQNITCLISTASTHHRFESIFIPPVGKNNKNDNFSVVDVVVSLLVLTN